MIQPIVATNDRVALVGGGDFNPNDFAETLALASVLVAADSGADAVLAQGHAPDAVIGDFDSISDAARAQIPDHRLHRISEQESTDFEKALRRVSTPLVLAVGFMGKRVDHQLAVFNGLVRHPDRRCIVIGAEEVVFVAPPMCEIALRKDDPVSLFPMGEAQGRSRGLVWPIDGLTLAPDGRIGTSNRAEGNVALEVDQPKLLVILPRRALTVAIAALETQARAWPAPVG